MIVKRCLSTLVILTCALAGVSHALTDNLDQLIREKNIIMPDLATAYPDAEAVIILDEKTIDQSRIINPVYITRHMVVKILKESAIERFRTVKVPVYTENRITAIEARTINDGQIVRVSDIPERNVDLQGLDRDFIYPLEQGTTMFLLRAEELNTNHAAGDLLKVNENPILHNRKDGAYKIRQIDFPDVRVGSVLEYEYRVEQKRAVLYDRFLFMQRDPVLKAVYNMKNSKMFRFVYQPANFTVRPTVQMENRFTNLDNQYNTDVRTKLRTIDVSDNPDQWQYFGHQEFEVSLDTVPAYPAGVPFIPSYQSLAPRVDVFLREAINVLKYSDIEYRLRPTLFSPSWNFVIQRMTPSYLVNDRQTRQARAEIAKAIAGAASPEDKVNAAVDWVRRNIQLIPELDRWEAFYWSSKPETPDNVLRARRGNLDDINHFLVSTLQLNGVAVYPAFAKSRSRGAFDMQMIMETQFDKPLVALEVGSRRFKFWQSVTDVPMPASYIEADLNGSAVFVNESGERDVTFVNAEVPVTAPETSRQGLEAVLSLGADGNASGQVKQTFTGHAMADIKRSLLAAGEAGQAAAWAGRIRGMFDLSAAAGTPQFDDPMQIAESFSVTGDVTLSGAARTVEGGLALKTGLLLDPYTAGLDGTEREIDVAFPFMADFSSTVTVRLPAGYSLPETLPEPLELRTRGLYYNRVITAESGSLVIKRQFTMGMQDIAPRVYNSRYAGIFAQIRQAESADLVLKR